VEICWQFRNAPRPVVRAVLSSLIVASVLAAAYLAYDVAISRGAVLPGGDLRVLFVAVLIAAVLVTGRVVTYLVVPLPKGSGERGRRSAWSAALGLFAAVPICYLVLVVAVQILKPLFTQGPGTVRRRTTSLTRPRQADGPFVPAQYLRSISSK
jgi:hypothetical protein